MVRGEEKQFEVTVDHLLEYTKGIKVSLFYLIQNIEEKGDIMSWPQILDAFTSICGQMNTLMRYTRENKRDFMENRVVLPLQLSPDRDDALVNLTENRVQVVNHDMVPDYLRTKPDPEIEEFERMFQNKASTISSEAGPKQVSATEKLIDGLIKTLKSKSNDADSEMSRQSIRPSFKSSETNELIKAVSTGRGLFMTGQPPPQRMIHSDTMMAPKMDSSRQQGMLKQNVRAPELKTSIRPAM